MMKMPSGLRLHEKTVASILAVGAVLVVLPALYAGIASSVQPKLPVLRNKRICLLIAHPDDEAMFFAPTVLALTRPELGNHVKILCLSSGDADGLGETRQRELQKSGVVLGLKAESDVLVVESLDFPDSMTTTWDREKISRFLARLFTTRSPNTRAPHPNIDVIITFDQDGISSHPNHISLYYGATSFVSKLSRLATLDGTDGSPESSPVDLYTLTTVGFLRKYSGFTDAVTSLSLFNLFGPGMKPPALPAPEDSDDETPEAPAPKGLLFFSPFCGSDRSLPSVSRARAAMTQAHISQMRWFRWGWITLSRYMYLNDLKLANPRVEPFADGETASSFGAPTEVDVSVTSDAERSERERSVGAASISQDREKEVRELRREKDKYMRKLEQERELEKERAAERERVQVVMEAREREVERVRKIKEQEEAMAIAAEKEKERARAEKKAKKHGSSKKSKK